MNEELLFEYPLKADRKRFESEILSSAPENFKVQRARAFVMLIIGLKTLRYKEQEPL